MDQEIKSKDDLENTWVEKKLIEVRFRHASEVTKGNIAIYGAPGLRVPFDSLLQEVKILYFELFRKSLHKFNLDIHGFWFSPFLLLFRRGSSRFYFSPISF